MGERRYRVLHVCSHPVQYMSPVLRRMAEHPKLEILVAYCSLQGANPGKDAGFGIEVKWDIPLLEGYPWVEVPNRSRRPALEHFFGLVNPGLWELVKTGKFDAVEVFTGYAYASFWILLSAAKLEGIPILFGTDATSLQPRDQERWKFPLKRILLPRIFRLADVVLAPSTATVDFVRSLGIPAQRIAMTPFVVDNENWSRRAAEADRSAVRASWGVEDNRPVVLFCAKLQPWKRPQDLLRAFAQTKAPDAHLVFAGEGPLRPQLQAESQELGLGGRAHFLGFVNQSQLPSVYKAADLLVLPSEYDPCPTVVCEAMVCGCPVVISNAIRGRFDLIWQGITGFIYPMGNVRALAKILDDVLRDPDQLRRLSAAAQRRMETWSPRENIEAHVLAVEKAIQLHSRKAKEARA
jgi:glycosyltransferase involved in cell wall biosynthesis